MQMSYFQRALNVEPAMVLSAVFGLGALAIPVVVPLYRRIHGHDTYQYDGGNASPVGAVVPSLCATTDRRCVWIEGGCVCVCVCVCVWKAARPCCGLALPHPPPSSAKPPRRCD